MFIHDQLFGKNDLRWEFLGPENFGLGILSWADYRDEFFAWMHA